MHIHIGYDKPNVNDSLKLVKYFDLCCGVPSVFHDTDTFRRSLYGQAGSFRMPSYGVEARCLSSKMLDDEVLPKVYRQVMTAIDFFNEGLPLPESDLIQRCINTSNQVLAKHIMSLYDIKFEY